MIHQQKPLEELTEKEFKVFNKAKEDFKETISYQNARNEKEEIALAIGYANHKVKVYNRGYSKLERQHNFYEV